MTLTEEEHAAIQSAGHLVSIGPGGEVIETPFLIGECKFFKTDNSTAAIVKLEENKYLFRCIFEGNKTQAFFICNEIHPARTITDFLKTAIPMKKAQGLKAFNASIEQLKIII